MGRGRHKKVTKDVITTIRNTQDMNEYISKAADNIGASIGELYRFSAYETANKILTDEKFAEELKIRFMI